MMTHRQQTLCGLQLAIVLGNYMLTQAICLMHLLHLYNICFLCQSLVGLARIADERSSLRVDQAVQSPCTGICRRITIAKVGMIRGEEAESCTVHACVGLV